MTQEPLKRSQCQQENPLRSGEEVDLDPEVVDYVESLLTNEMVERLARVTDWNKAAPVLALAILHRIKRLWTILFGHQWLSTRIVGDEELYKQLRHSLIVQLKDRLEVEAEAARVLPNSLLTGVEMELLDADIRAFFDSEFQSLESTLLDLIIQEGTSIDTSQFQALLVTHDDTLDAIDEAVSKEYERELVRLKLTTDPSLKRLDYRIEQVELGLRKMISDRLEGDEELVPRHVFDKVLERWTRSDRKNLTVKRSSLISKLEFADLRELESILESKLCRSRFSPEFRDTQMVQRRFDQLVELRNSFRHSRSPDSVTLDDGKASIVWFERALTKDGTSAKNSDVSHSALIE